MGGPRQLFFFQCGPEMPKGWTALVEDVSVCMHTHVCVCVCVLAKSKLSINCSYYLYSKQMCSLPCRNMCSEPANIHFDFLLKG